MGKTGLTLIFILCSNGRNDGRHTCRSMVLLGPSGRQFSRAGQATMEAQGSERFSCRAIICGMAYSMTPPTYGCICRHMRSSTSLLPRQLLRRVRTILSCVLAGRSAALDRGAGGCSIRGAIRGTGKAPSPPPESGGKTPARQGLLPQADRATCNTKAASPACRCPGALKQIGPDPQALREIKRSENRG